MRLDFTKVAKSAAKRGVADVLVATRTLDWLDRIVGRGPTIVVLHRVLDECLVAAQVDLTIRRGYNCVTLEQIDRWVCGDTRDASGDVAFAVDDGYGYQADFIRTIFLSRGVPVSAFLITDFIDGKMWPWDARLRWLVETAYHENRASLQRILRRPGGPHGKSVDEMFRFAVASVGRLPPERLEETLSTWENALGLTIPREPPARFAPMTWDEVRSLERQGVRFGSHSCSHYVLSTLSDEEVEREIVMSCRRLREELVQPLSVFCYPLGMSTDYSARDMVLLRKHKCTSAVTMSPGEVIRSGPWDRYQIRRYGMPESSHELLFRISSLSRVRQGLNGLRGFLHQRFGNKRGSYEYARALLSYRFGAYNAAVDWARVRRFVFVCHGNVCRSAFAVKVAKALGIPAESFGLATDPGAKANIVASRVALTMGYDLTDHRSKLLDARELRHGDLVLVMEPSHLKDPRLLAVAERIQVVLLGLLHPNTAIPHITDPYGLSEDYFRKCFKLIEQTVGNVARLGTSNSTRTTSQQSR